MLIYWRIQYTITAMTEKSNHDKLLSQKNTVVWKSEIVPIDGDLFWSAFDDFIALQKHFPLYSNVKVEQGTGEVGTVISYDFLDCRMKEKLTMKDDHVKACKIDLVQSNVLFSQFNVALKVNNCLFQEDFLKACEVTMVVNVEFAKQIYFEEQIAITERLDHIIMERIQDIILYIAKTKGEYIVRESRVYCNIDILWKKLINWGRASFSRGASCVELSPDKKTRKIHFGNKICVERFRSMSSTLHIVIYEVLKSDLIPVQYCYGSYCLVELNTYITKLIHELHCIPENEELRLKVNKQMTAIMEEQMTMIAGTYFNIAEAPVSNVRGKYFLKVDGTIQTPAKEAWSIVRSFKDSLKWYPFIDYLEVEPPGEDIIGATRILRSKFDKRYLRERLEDRNDQEFFIKYSMLSDYNSPVKCTNATTTISLKPISDSSTKIAFELRFDAPNAFVASFIIQSLEPYYDDAIKSLDQIFNSVIGYLTVTIVKGNNLRGTKTLFNPDPYVSMHLEDAEEQRVKVCRGTTEPYWNQENIFNLRHKNDKIRFVVWDYDYFGRDDLIGTTEIGFSTLKSGVEKEFELKLMPQGILVVRLLIEMKEGQEIPLALEKKTMQKLLRMRSYMDNIKEGLSEIMQSLLQGNEDNPYDWNHFKRLKSQPHLPLEDLPGFAKALPVGQFLSPSKCGRLLERCMEFLHSQIGFIERITNDDKWNAFFHKWLSPPKRLMEEWQNDEEFCRQYIQGVNPMMIKLCRSIEEIPLDMRHLTAQNKTTSELIEENRLFIVDYKMLEDIPLHKNFKLYVPVILMYREIISLSQSRLMVLGIQLTRNPDNNILYTPSSPPNRYLFAKIQVSCADHQIHQFIFHLGLTHLLIEAVAVSYHNFLKLTHHPLVALLDCHFKETIGVNFVARCTLISQIAPFTDNTFAVGMAGGFKLLLNYWHKFRFTKFSFPNELKHRGFTEDGADGLQDYYYRDDGFKIWNALKKYVSEYIDQEYPNDRSVASDKVLQMFASSVISPSEGNIPGFPYKLETKACLVDCLVNIIFTCTAQHAALNLPQYYYYSFIPNRPCSLNNFMPEGDTDITWDFIQNSLPNIDTCHFQIMWSYLMTLTSTSCLLRISNLRNSHPQIQSRFQDELKTISSHIQERNAKLEAVGKISYPYLDPENIPISIDI